jgi:hypothetical protein
LWRAVDQTSVFTVSLHSCQFERDEVERSFVVAASCKRSSFSL